jgi:hypothetical protein
VSDHKLQDFRNFLYVVWKHLGLPNPTDLQYDIADYMQHGPKRGVIMAFRGVGKSWICSAYVTHQLLLDPSKNILVVSASKNRSDDFSTFTLRIINELPILAGLKPRDGQRFSKVSFDVGSAPPAHAPSVKSLGITSQLTGSRADIVVADDVEVPNNSATQGLRDKLDEQVKEFEAIIKPLDSSKILFLGTPQCEDSIYNKLRERGYTARIWPSEFLERSKASALYDGCLSPYIVSKTTPESVGRSTEPLRFSDVDLEERKLSYGRSGYALQFLLNPRLSDADRYPLKINDLIVNDVDDEVGPEKITYASGSDYVVDNTIPNVGFNGDRFFRPMSVGELIPYTGSVLSIDPSGRGRDETSYAVVKMLNGQLFVPACNGLKGGYSDNTLKELAMIAARYDVNKVIVESNMGDGMFTELFKPLLRNVHPVSIEEVRHSKQKERRIIDTLEPVMNRHKLIFDPSVIKDDYRSALAYPIEQQTRYMLFYQLSRITKDKGSLMQDDRLDALAMAVAYWVEQMAQDADVKIDERKTDALKEELESFITATVGGSKVKQTLWM